MPCSRYRADQTGPKTQLGGLKAGFANVAYQVLISELVASDPIAPAANGRSNAIISKPIADHELCVFVSMPVVYRGRGWAAVTYLPKMAVIDGHLFYENNK